MTRAFTRLNTQASRKYSYKNCTINNHGGGANEYADDGFSPPHAHIWRQRRRPQLIHTIKGGPDKAALKTLLNN